MQINEMQLAVLTIQLSALGQTDLRDNDREALETLKFLLEQALNSVRGAMTVRAEKQYRTVEITVLGHDIPVEVEFTPPMSEDNLYELAKEQLRRMI